MKVKRVDTDLGRPTPKQLKAIEETSHETYTEQEFYNMLETGFSEQKRRHSVSSVSLNGRVDSLPLESVLFST